MSKKKLTEEEELYKKELYKQEQKEYIELSKRYNFEHECGTPCLIEKQRIKERYRKIREDMGIIN